MRYNEFNLNFNFKDVCNQTDKVHLALFSFRSHASIQSNKCEGIEKNYVSCLYIHVLGVVFFFIFFFTVLIVHNSKGLKQILLVFAVKIAE